MRVTVQYTLTAHVGACMYQQFNYSIYFEIGFKELKLATLQTFALNCDDITMNMIIQLMFPLCLQVRLDEIQHVLC